MIGKNMRKKTAVRKICFYSGILIIVFLALVPLIHIVLTSFRPSSEVLSVRPQWIPRTLFFKHYQYALSAQPVVRYLFNSLVLSLSVVGVVLMIGSLAAYGLARYKFRGDILILLILIIMRMVPMVSILVPLYIVFGAFKLLDTLAALIIAHIAFKLPVAIWLLRSFFQDIPKELEESAKIDGCTTMGVLARIVLPLAKPGLVASAIISFLFTWNDLIVALALTSSEEAQTITVGLANFILVYQIQWGPMCAAGVFMLIPITIFALLAGKHLLRGLVLGAVKE